MQSFGCTAAAEASIGCISGRAANNPKKHPLSSPENCSRRDPSKYTPKHATTNATNTHNLSTTDQSKD